MTGLSPQSEIALSRQKSKDIEVDLWRFQVDTKGS